MSWTSSALAAFSASLRRSGLDHFERHALLLPQLGALAALAIGEADDGDVVALACMQRDRAAAAPDEIRRMRADDQCGLVGHGFSRPMRSSARRRAVGVEALDGLQAPGLALLALGLRPGDRLPVGIEDEPRAGIGDLDAVAGRLVDIEEEGLLDGVLVRAGLDEDPVLQEDVGRAQDVVAMVGRVGDVVEAALGARMVLGAGHVVALVVDGEPAAADAAIVELDHLGHAAAHRLDHEVADLRDVAGEQVEVVEPARRGAPAVEALGDVLQRRLLGLRRLRTCCVSQ
jgi:hypothetical protein